MSVKERYEQILDAISFNDDEVCNLISKEDNPLVFEMRNNGLLLASIYKKNVDAARIILSKYTLSSYFDSLGDSLIHSCLYEQCDKIAMLIYNKMNKDEKSIHVLEGLKASAVYSDENILSFFIEESLKIHPLSVVEDKLNSYFTNDAASDKYRDVLLKFFSKKDKKALQSVKSSEKYQANTKLGRKF